MYVFCLLVITLDKHLLQAGGFDLLELLELDGVLGNQRVECAEVGADFLLFWFTGKGDVSGLN